MPVTHDIMFGTVAATSGKVAVRSPLGEVWQLQRFEADGINPDLEYVTPAATTGFPLVVNGPDKMAGPLWIDNANAWVQVRNLAGTVQNYALYLLKYQQTDVPMKIWAVPASTGSVDFRPPVGTDMLVKLAHSANGGLTGFVNATTATNGATTATTHEQVGSTLKYGAAVSVLMTNSTWLRMSTGGGTTHLFVITYAELAAGTLAQVAGISVMAAAGFMDVRAPLGEVWTIGAWTGSATTLPAVYDGVTRYTPAVDNWPHMKANIAVSNAKWVQLAVGATAGTLGYIGWKHPLA